MTEQQAMRMALEALQFALHVGFDESSESQIKKGDNAGQQHRAAITALRQALANQALDKKAENARELGLDYEPVAWWGEEGVRLKYNDKFAVPKGTPLYFEQQKPWIGLVWSDTPDKWVGNTAFMEGAKWAEEALQEKNT